MVSSEEALRKRLLDPTFWRPRLASLSEIPRQLTVQVRADLSQPGIDVLELQLIAHDGVSLRAFLARSAFHNQPEGVRIRPCHDLTTCAIDWRSVEAGLTDVVFPRLVERRMEDRVLDVLRLIDAVASVERVGEASVHLHVGMGALPDEFVVAELVRALRSAPAGSQP
jgi:hypothetical protein